MNRLGRIAAATAVMGIGSVMVAGAPVSANPAPSAPLAPQAAAQAVDEVGVTVTGEGRITATPDTARVVLGVEVQRPDVATAFADANATAQAVIDALVATGVAEEDIQTRELSIREQREPVAEGEFEIVGFVVSNLVEVTIDDLDAAGDVLTAAVDAGGDDLRLRRFELLVEQDSDQVRAARDAAFADARQRAEQYAALAGRELGELVEIREVISPGPIPIDGGAVAEDAAAVPIQPGTEDVVVRIETRWELGAPVAGPPVTDPDDTETDDTETTDTTGTTETTETTGTSLVDPPVDPTVPVPTTGTMVEPPVTAPPVIEPTAPSSAA
ncbi:MAG: SIMPL domain-containing protein [Actinomycetota bacterium]|nr:SIMPL domain-containing protein [Actinomycetota bacterium]